MKILSKDVFEVTKAKTVCDNKEAGVRVIGVLGGPGSINMEVWEICLVIRNGE